MPLRYGSPRKLIQLLSSNLSYFSDIIKFSLSTELSMSVYKQTIYLLYSIVKTKQNSALTSHCLPALLCLQERSGLCSLSPFILLSDSSESTLVGPSAPPLHQNNISKFSSDLTKVGFSQCSPYSVYLIRFLLKDFSWLLGFLFLVWLL